MKKAVQTVLAIASAILLTGLGVALFVHANLGSDTITVFIDGLHRILNVSYGTASRIYNIIMLIIALIVSFKNIGWATIIYALTVGFAMDFFEVLLTPLNIENMNTRKLALDLGAGSTLIKDIYSDNTNINTGAGSFTIVNGNINDLDLDIGVGKTNITSMITGNSTIDIGIGSLSLNLIGNNYTFKVNKGIGKVLIDNKEVSDNEVLGMGSNTIKLNGGIGDTTVTLNKDR